MDQERPDYNRIEASRKRREEARRRLVTGLVVAGAGIAIGLVVLLFIFLSAAGGGRKVPDVVGMSYEDARGKIEASGFSVEIDQEQDTSEVENLGKARVGVQNPKAGTQAEQGELVTVSLKGLGYVSKAGDPESSPAPGPGEGGTESAGGSAPAPVTESVPADATQPATPPQTPATGSGRSVCIDPGHSTGSPASEIDPATGLDVADNGGASGELQANWELAVKVRQRLERAGYSVTMTKSTADSYASLRTRADTGNNCSVMVRLHYDPSLHAILYPGDGQYKQHGNSIVYVDPAVANASAGLAQAMFPFLQGVGVSRKMNDAGGTSNNTGAAYVGSVLSRVPVVLIENDPSMVSGNPSGQDRVADAIVQGLNSYFQGH